ncbi:MAG: helix-hairpin-helix domain-containing protein [Lachnospiraceae bacterium]|nr:helix-hairpin-helix domain-containing protein [Lachnospiraceae bacterium]
MDKKKTIKVVIAVCAVILCGVIYCYTGKTAESEVVVTEGFSDDSGTRGKEKETSAPDDKSELENPVYVHICGEVKKPGVYIFDKEPRVAEVVEKAGGFTKKADRAAINLAEAVQDGTQLQIVKKAKKASEETSEEGEKDSGKININKASKEELMTISGIGESKASQIIAYRETNGRFARIEDIMNISGIKNGIFEKIKDFITV